jgi:3-mercaptopropionate dioxygenase
MVRQQLPGFHERPLDVGPFGGAIIENKGPDLSLRLLPSEDPLQRQVSSMPIPRPCIASALRLRKLSPFSRTLSEAYLEQVRATIRDIIADSHLVDGFELQRQHGRYSRTLLFGDAEMSTWAILWPPGSRTCVHDHHCSCCFGVARGSLKEIRFRAVNDEQAVLEAVAVREPGYVAATLPTGPNIHQMINDSDREALSVHVYGFDHMMHSSSIHREYEVVTQ